MCWNLCKWIGKVKIVLICKFTLYKNKTLVVTVQILADPIEITVPEV